MKKHVDHKPTGIDLTNTTILWDCKTDFVKLVKHPQSRYGSMQEMDAYSWGACNSEIYEGSFQFRKMALFIQAWQMAMDGITPSKIHKSLMPLDEYRSGIAYDRLWVEE